MDEITLRSAIYRGSKDVNLQSIPTAKATGFGAAADDYMERGIDLNEQLIKNKPATYFFRMHSDAMLGAGIQPGDILIVDRSLKATSGKTIIAALNGDLVVRKLLQTDAGVTLAASNTKYANIQVNEMSGYRVWGVVTYVIHATF